MILVSKSSTGNSVYSISNLLSTRLYLAHTLQRAFASNTQRAWGATDVGSGRRRRPFIPPVSGWSAVWRRPRSARTDVTQHHMTRACRWSCCSVITQRSGCDPCASPTAMGPLTVLHLLLATTLALGNPKSGRSTLCLHTRAPTTLPRKSRLRGGKAEKSR